jgi:hypothetical protein
MRRTTCAVLLVVIGLVGLPVRAQQPDYVPDQVEANGELKKPGWHPMLKASGTVAFGHAKNVVGMDDGSTWNIGLMLDGALGWRHKSGHVWENLLKYQLAYSKTPLLEDFVKSLDNLDFRSTYLYEIPKVPWLGPFASFRLVTSVLPGYLLRPGDMTLVKVDMEGVETTETLAANTRLDLTESFAPLTLRESVGMFANPITKKVFDAQARLGVGAWEVFVQEGWALDSDADGVLTVKQMQDSMQAGGELELTAKGVLATGVNYGLRASFMLPFYHNADTDLEGMDLLNQEYEATLGVKLAEWASLDYALKAFKYPLIVDQFQISNSLLLTATASIL